MRRADNIGASQLTAGGKIGGIGLYLTVFQCFNQRIIIHNGATGIIDEVNPVFHLGNSLLADKALVLSVQRDMHRDKVVFRKKMIQVIGKGKELLQFFLTVGTKVRVITGNDHTQIIAGARHPRTDRTNANNPDPLPPNLWATVYFLALFHRLTGFFLSIFQAIHPCAGALHITAGHNHSCNGQLFYGIGIAPWCIKDGNTGLGAAVHRDGIDPCTHADNRFQFGRKCHIVQRCGMDNDRIGMIGLIQNRVVVFIKGTAAGFRNFVVGFNEIHDVSPFK